MIFSTSPIVISPGTDAVNANGNSSSTVLSTNNGDRNYLATANTGIRMTAPPIAIILVEVSFMTITPRVRVGCLET